MKLRATSLQVDNILLWPNDPIDPATIENICRDWLDMQAAETRLIARAEAAERVVSAARDVMHVRFIGSGDTYRQCVQCGAMSLYANVDVSHHEGCTGSALRDALADYDAQRTEDA